MQSAINSIVKGSLLIALIQGLLATIGFMFSGVPNSILWGTFAAIASLVPRVGTALIIIPAILYLLITSSVVSVIFLTVWGIAVVGIVDNILGPKLIGKELSLHPLSILFSVIGGILFFGPSGIFLGPLSVSLLVALVSVYENLHADLHEHTE